METASAQTCITSPPYWGLRDYGVEGQLGLEATPDEYVAKLVDVFREVRRVLSDDGTCWLNMGDSYTSGNRASRSKDAKLGAREMEERPPTPGGLKAKDLVGIPWLVAFALRDDGWFLRSDIIWEKPSAMPESVADRPSNSHEHIFLLAKSAHYYYDADAIREPITSERAASRKAKKSGVGHSALRPNGAAYDGTGTSRNRRSVWSVAAQPFLGAHFAVFPPKLIEPCVLAGSREGDTVLDPFAGSGTTGMVALRHNRNFIGIELNPEYAEMARKRIIDDAPLLNGVTA